jgi:hypothetical protein
LVPPLLLGLVILVTGALLWAIASGGHSAKPRRVSQRTSRREIEARRQATEEAIEEIGRRTREQMHAVAEQHRRQGSA